MASIMGVCMGCLLRARVPSRSKAMREIILLGLFLDEWSDVEFVLLWRLYDGIAVVVESSGGGFCLL